MRLILLNYEFPPLGGGAGNATRYIARDLAIQGHQVLVLTSHFGNLPSSEHTEGYQVVRLSVRRTRVDRSSVLEMLSFVWAALTEGTTHVREFAPDGVIAFFAVPSGIAAWWWNKRLQVPYVISLRGGDVPGFLGKELRLLHLLSVPFTALVWRGAHAVVANSRGLQALAQKTATRLRLTRPVDYIPNGVDTDFFCPPTTPPSVPRVLFVGRLVPQKGVTFLLKALASLRDKGTTIPCDIVGDGPLKTQLEQESVELGLVQVSFLGWLSKDQLKARYQAATVFVLPSYEEGMPNVVLEAMACGLPVISTRVAGTEELVEYGKSGFLIESPGDPTLFEYIQKLVTDESLCTYMRQGARQKATPQQWGLVAKQYTALPFSNSFVSPASIP